MKSPRGPQPTKIDSVKETRESWTPLEIALGHAQCTGFMCMGSGGRVQQYKHIDTRRYLYIDAIRGHFYDDEHMPISSEATIDHVVS